MTGALFGTGDLVAQYMKPKDKMDYPRFFRMTIYGLLVGPMMVNWYKLLDLKFKPVITRVGVDQLIGAPISILLFFTLTGIMDQKSAKDIQSLLNDQYFRVLKLNYLVWPVFQFINFKYVPLNFQTVVVGGLAVGWNAFLSIVNNNS